MQKIITFIFMLSLVFSLFGASPTPLSQKVGALIHVLGREAGPLPPLSNDNEGEILNSIIKLYFPEGEVVPKKAEKSTVKKTTLFEVFRGVTIDKRSVFYLRIDSFSKKQYEQLKQDCEIMSYSPKQPVGCVIDLRNTHNGDLSYLKQSIELFTKKKKGEMLFHKQTFIVLLSTSTAFQGIAFTACLKSSRDIFIIGAKAKAIQPPKKRIKFDKQWDILLPDYPSWVSQNQITSLVPDLFFSKNRQISFKEIGNFLDTQKKDGMLILACDLLKSVHIIHKHTEDHEKEKRK